MTSDTAALIARLADEAGPVRRLRPPAQRALLWLAAASAFIALVVLYHGLRPDFAEQFARPAVQLQLYAALLTGALAGLATFQVSIPGRSRCWAALPLPALGLWLASVGWGCLADWLRLGRGAFAMGASLTCLQTIVLMSLPLGFSLLRMVRHAGPVRPELAALLGGLAVAALSSAGLTLFHALDTALMVLVWHLGSVSLVVGASWAFSGRLFAWAGAR